MKRRSAILLAGALLALLFVIANLLVSRLVGGRQLDATASGRYTLTEESLKTVAALRQPVTIRLYVSENCSPPGTNSAPMRLGRQPFLPAAFWPRRTRYGWKSGG